jgi:hypothetical protein
MIEIDDQIYHKIIYKDKIPLRDGIVTICIPKDLFDGAKVNAIVDESGKTFELGGIVFFSFRGEIPRWYLETITVVVEGIHDENRIGSYISVII